MPEGGAPAKNTNGEEVSLATVDSAACARGGVSWVKCWVLEACVTECRPQTTFKKDKSRKKKQQQRHCADNDTAIHGNAIIAPRSCLLQQRPAKGKGKQGKTRESTSQTFTPAG
eukprot:m.61228 g.61228  ORF g.61228 m.61228 type:complete len:114 (-) comp13191_c0_seq2:130-471(-)